MKAWVVMILLYNTNRFPVSEGGVGGGRIEHLQCAFYECRKQRNDVGPVDLSWLGSYRYREREIVYQPLSPSLFSQTPPPGCRLGAFHRYSRSRLSPKKLRLARLSNHLALIFFSILPYCTDTTCSPPSSALSRGRGVCSDFCVLPSKFFFGSLCRKREILLYFLYISVAFYFIYFHFQGVICV